MDRKIACIDLSKGKVEISSVPEELTGRYIGGRGLDSYLLYNHLEGKPDPLSPENVIVVGAGFLGGMLAPAAAWTHIASKSPLTGYLSSTVLGEFFAPELRWAGFDHLVIKGKSPKPAFLFIRDGEIQIRDASGIWGKTVEDTGKALKEELDDEDVQLLCIGPAGEKLVRFAGVTTRFQNSGGQTGIGAVFGSKHLKAIAVRGTRGIEIKFPREALEYDRQIVRNMRSGEESRMLPGEGGVDSCFGCQIHCRRRAAVDEMNYFPVYFREHGDENPEVWDAASGDMDTILAANQLVDSYGLDRMETSRLVTLATGLYENGTLTGKDTDGLELERGNDEAVIAVIHQIGRRDGLGDILAEGEVRAAKELGILPAVSSIVSASGGVDSLPWWQAADIDELQESEVQVVYGQPYCYEDFFSAENWGYEGEYWPVFRCEMCGMVADMLGMCKLQFTRHGRSTPGFEGFSRMVYLNTGLKLAAEEIWDCAVRAFTMERLFNLRQGYKSEDDWPPERYFSEPASGGKTFDREKFKVKIDEYYRIHQWNEKGIPKPELLEKLKLDEEPSHRL